MAPTRVTESAIKGLLAKPEDRTAVVKNMVEQAGGKLLAWYMLFGEYDWITVYEMPSGKEAAGPPCLPWRAPVL